MVSSTRSLKIIAVPAFEDNYLWLLVHGRNAVVVDPGDAGPVEAALAARGLALRAILLTHHHADHVGGVAALIAARPAVSRTASIPVYGPLHEEIAGVTHPLEQGDAFDLPVLGLHFDVLDVPGHTRGHIAYVARSDDDEPPLLFCGDTLFAAGCGRLFEGTASQMHQSLAKLAALPSRTRVYCAHEYTLANLRFAHAVEPHNDALVARIAEATTMRERGEPTLPSTIALERATNPFLRADQTLVAQAAEQFRSGASASPLATFAALRSWKDIYR